MNNLSMRSVYEITIEIHWNHWNHAAQVVTTCRGKAGLEMFVFSATTVSLSDIIYHFEKPALNVMTN